MALTCLPDQRSKAEDPDLVVGCIALDFYGHSSSYNAPRKGSCSALRQ